jgi:excisionase family DNA binding protein
MKRYLTIPEVALPLGLTEKALRQRILRGQLPYRKLGTRVLIPVDELEQVLAALPGKTANEIVAEQTRVEVMNEDLAVVGESSPGWGPGGLYITTSLTDQAVGKTALQTYEDTEVGYTQCLL